MKQYFLKSLFIFSNLYTVGCNSSFQGPINPPDTWVIPKDKSEHALSDLLVDDYQLIALETTDSSLVSKVEKVILEDSLVFVFDKLSTNSIMVFNLEGKYLNSIGILGEGPGELKNPVDFFILEQSCFIYDNPDNLLRFDFQGNFLGSNSTGITGFKLEKDSYGNFIFINGGKEFNLLTMNDDFKEIEKFFPYKSRVVDQLILSPLIKLTSGDVLYRRFLKDTIFKINQRGQPDPYLIIDHNKPYSLEKDWRDLPIDDVILEEKIGSYAVNQLYLENLSHQIVYFQNGLTPYFAVRNKVRKDSKLFDFLNFKNDVTNTPNLAFTFTSDDWFIALIESSELLSNPINKDANSGKVRSILEILDDGDNPVLLISKFK